MLFLTCSGTESNELALRMARSHTQKQGIICTNATYHGNSAAVYALATLFNDGNPLGPNVKSVDFPQTYHALNGLSGSALTDAHLNQVSDAIKALEDEGVGFAGMLVCPIFANEGLPNMPTGYFEKLKTIIAEADGLLIFDEVQSAFGRTGEMWGHTATGITPDLMVLGKPMGNGHPLSAVLCRPDIGNGFRDNSMYFNTFGGNPVSCAVGQAVLDVLEDEKLIENTQIVGQYIQSEFGRLANKFDLIGDVRGAGLFAGIELVTDRANRTPASDEASRVVNRMKEEGVLISRIGVNENILKIRPPLCFSQDNAKLFIETLSSVMSEI